MSQKDHKTFNELKDKILSIFINEVQIGNTDVTFTKEELYGSYKLYFHEEVDPLPIDEALQSLLDEGVFSLSEQSYQLTKVGVEKVNSYYFNSMDKMLSEVYVSMHRSQTLRNIFTALYGHYLGQINVLDQEQEDKLVSLLEQAVGEGDKVLDLGCGLGLITGFLQEKTHAYFTGFDIASGPLAIAKKSNINNKNIEFVHGDMNELNFPDESFDLILAIDSLTNVYDLTVTLSKLKRMVKKGRKSKAIMILTDTGWINDETGKTKLTQCLIDSDLKYTLYDYTENENKFWVEQTRLLEENKEDFLKEGNEEFFDMYYQDVKGMAENREETPATRYLFEVFFK